MKYFIYLGAIITILGINVGFFGIFRLGGTVPNLLFLLVLFSSLDMEENDFLFVAFFCGLFLDAWAGLFPGALLLPFLLLAGFLRVLAGRAMAFETDWRLQLGLAILGLQLLAIMTWFYGFLAVKWGWTGDVTNLAGLERNFIWQGAYTFALFYPMYLLYNFIKKLIARAENRKYKISS